jgi:hypothetical protein
MIDLQSNGNILVATCPNGLLEVTAGIRPIAEIAFIHRQGKCVPREAEYSIHPHRNL